jgi:hypothetical protein
MDSFLKGKLNQVQAKLANAAKYIPKDIIKNIPQIGKKKNNEEIKQENNDAFTYDNDPLSPESFEEV